MKKTINATAIALLMAAIASLAAGAPSSAPTTSGLSYGGQTTIAVCFPDCVDSTATDPLSYTLDGGAATVGSSVTLLADNRTVLLNVSGLAASNYTLDIGGGQIQTCAGGVIDAFTLTGSVASSLVIADIGAPNIAGKAFSCAPGNLGLIAGGNGYRTDADQLAFAYESITGDFDKKLQIASLSASDGTDVFARGGLMVRQSTEPGATVLKLLASNPAGDNAVRILVRADIAQPYDEVDRAYGGVSNNLPNQWLRIKRVGNSFQMFVGLDGVKWSLLARRWQELPATVLVGCYAAASHEGATATVQFNSYADVDLGDQTPPTLVSAGTLDKQVVGVKFSETINSATATVLANYTVLDSHGAPVTITGAKLGIEGDAVYLSVAGLTSDTFTVRVNGGVTDSAGNSIVAPTSVAGKVSPWLSDDIGSIQDSANRPSGGDDPPTIGQAVAVSSDDNPEIEILGGGSNFGDAGDYVHFVHRSMTGDFDVMLEMTRYDRCYETGGEPKAGIMARNSLYNPGEEFTQFGTKVPFYANVTSAEDTQGLGALSIWRDAPHGSTDDSFNNQGLGVFAGDLIGGINGAFGSLRSANASGDTLPNSSPNGARWLRLRRVGDHFTSYASYDGRVWQQFEDADHQLNSTLEVGIVTVNDSGNTAPPGNAYDGDNQRPSMYSVVHVRHLGATPLLNLARLDGSSASLSWSAGSLQCAPTLSGPWTDCANQANPQTITLIQATPAVNRFYRLH